MPLCWLNAGSLARLGEAARCRLGRTLLSMAAPCIYSAWLLHRKAMRSSAGNRGAPRGEAEKLGRALGNELLERGARRILDAVYSG